MKQKDAKNEFTYDVPNYFNACNVFKCGRKLLDRLDVSYERAYMTTPREVYFAEMLENLKEHNCRHRKLFSSKKLQEAVIRVMEESEEEAESSVNNVTTDTSFQSPVFINAQKKDANMSYERWLTSGILAETIK